MNRGARFLVGVFVLALLPNATQAELLKFECGFPTDLGFGAGNAAACYADPAQQEKFLRRGNHCDVDEPERTESVVSFKLHVETESLAGIATTVVRRPLWQIDIARKVYNEKKNEKAKEILDEYERGDEELHIVRGHLDLSYVNWLDPITEDYRENERAAQFGHIFVLSGRYQPSVLFVDKETSAAIWTEFNLLGQVYWSNTKFGRCKIVDY